VPLITSKITSKSQTTIPKAVHAALNLKQGDELVYRIEDGTVTLTRHEVHRSEDAIATFTEWDSEADRKAYGRL
jgi:antitoxin PrlF